MSIPAWRQERETPSLSEVFRTIAVGNGGTSRFRRFLAFIGPGYLVAVGYMDPGNWATSLAGGAAFGYTLLFVALLSNIMAILLQSLCARLAVASGRDLAQACRDAFPKWMSVPLWVFAELAIIATDLAEVIGTAIGLNLLFGIPLEIGIFITAADVFLILWLQNKGFRWIEALIISLMALIAACFVVLIAQSDPVWGDVIAGLARAVRSSATRPCSTLPLASSEPRSCRITSICIRASCRPAPLAWTCPPSARRCGWRLGTAPLR